MRRSLPVFSVYVILTLALTYPLIVNLSTALPNDPGDPALNTWILWWNAHAVPYTAAWWNAPAFYPAPGSLAFSENLLGLSAIATPIQWLGGGPQLAYNIVLLLTFPLCAYGAYLLAFELTGRHDAAFIGGLLFGFAPYRIAHLPQIQCLAAFPMPFALLGLHRYLRDPRPQWLWLFGAGWFLQAICNGYYMLFFAIVIGLWILWFAPPASRPKTAAAVTVAWVAASLPLLPLLLQYRAIHAGFGFAREFGTIRDFGADVAALLNAASALAFWGWLRVYRRAEGELFPGLTIVVLVVLGALARTPTTAEPRAESREPRGVRAVRRAVILVAAAATIMAMRAAVSGPWRFTVFGVQLFSVSQPVKPLTYALALTICLLLTSPTLRRTYSSRSAIGFYAIAALVTWLFSLGPAPSLMGKPFMYRGPYALLMFLPGFNALRVPARFWMMTTLCLSVIGAIMFDRLTARLGRKRIAAAALVGVGVLADGWVAGFPLAKPPSPWKIEGCLNAAAETGAVLELPLGDPFLDVAAMYRGMTHGRAVVNGYSGFFPPHYAALRFGLAMRDDDVLTQLAGHGVTHVAVNPRQDGDGRWRRYIEAHAGARLVCSDDGGALYHVPGPPAGSLERSDGHVLPIAVLRASVNDRDVQLMTDGDRTTRWQSGPQSDRTVIDVDLGADRSVNAVELWLGPYVEDFPRMLSVEMLGEGAAWKELYRGGTAGRAFVGAVQSPQDVPLTITFPAVRTRYLRLRTLVNDETYYWSVAELKVFGAP